MAIVFTRVIILYILIVVSMRVMGKRQLGELEPNELVMAMIISDLASVPMQDMGIPLLSGILPIVTLVALNLLISMISVKNIRFRTLVNGASSIVIRNGEIVQYEMRKNRFTVDELFEELRLKGYTDLSKIKYGILESNGQMSVIPFANEAPPSAADMNLNVKGNELQTIIINAGRILKKNLTGSGHDQKWLDKVLKEKHIKSPEDVYLLTVDETEGVYVLMKKPDRKVARGGRT